MILEIIYRRLKRKYQVKRTYSRLDIDLDNSNAAGNIAISYNDGIGTWAKL